jgi:hypothetical protein
LLALAVGLLAGTGIVRVWMIWLAASICAAVALAGAIVVRQAARRLRRVD